MISFQPHFAEAAFIIRRHCQLLRQISSAEEGHCFDVSGPVNTLAETDYRFSQGLGCAAMSQPLATRILAH